MGNHPRASAAQPADAKTSSEFARTDEPFLMETVAARIRRIEADPLPANIPALLQEAARDAPDRDAIHIIATGETLTYADLRDKVARLANGLLARGVRPGGHVAVMLPNVMAMPLTWLALARLGAVMVPVNTRYTGRELHHLLVDSEASHLVIDHGLLSSFRQMPADLPEIERRLIVVGPNADAVQSWGALVEASPAGFPDLPEPALDDLMNIQYTSGTTGLPKGCMLTHRYWLTCAKAYSDCDELSYRRILAGNPFFYMTPQWLLLMAFMQRATLFVASHRSLTHYMAWIRTHRIEFCLVPFDVLTQRPPEPDDSRNEMKRGNIYIHRKERHAEMEERFGFPVRTAFGMTEIGMGTFTPLEAREMTGSGSCGMAAPFRECRIADVDGEALGPGQIGELQFRGPGLLQGYYRNPQATAAAFIDGWFRSGDLATRDARGFYTIVGRIKEMIRRAGENISAAEVEEVLLGLPGIAEAAAVAVPDELRGEEIKAYLVLNEGLDPKDLPPRQVIAHCARQLAPFKIPRYLHYRTEPLPRSTSGKVRKPDLAGVADWRIGSWDRVQDTWLGEAARASADLRGSSDGAR
jgi:acyl-CoA synthetase (AMP-forming)/AMP-acid ligase II